MRGGELMHAVVLTGHGDIDKLEYRDDWPKPQPGPDDVLIEIHACGLNNTDVNTRTAWYSKSADAGDAAWGGAPIAFPFLCEFGELH
jgi:NADPH:quinone reductase-like Zn-dependent oxidoreductase